MTHVIVVLLYVLIHFVTGSLSRGLGLVEIRDRLAFVV